MLIPSYEMNRRDQYPSLSRGMNANSQLAYTLPWLLFKSIKRDEC